MRVQGKLIDVRDDRRKRVLIFASLALAVGFCRFAGGQSTDDAKLAAWKEDIQAKEKAISTRLVTAPPKGDYYEALVPDTLDLADRGTLLVNFLTGMVEPEHGYEMYLGSFFNANPAYMSHGNIGGYLDVPKAIEALPQARLMSGSKQNLDIERGLMLRVLALSWDDGLLYSPVVSQPWVSVFKEDVVHVPLIARLMLAMMYWYEYDGNPLWLEHARKIFNTIRTKIIHYDGPDYAYVPNYTVEKVRGFTSGYNITRAGYPTKVSGPDYGFGLYILGNYLRAMCKYAQLTGDKEALELARKMVNTLRRPECEPFYRTGFPHFIRMVLQGFLHYAELTNDEELKQLSRKRYEHIRNFGISEVGWVPQEMRSVPLPWSWTENDNMAALGVMAVELSEHGVGDYWDDADQYVRNQMTEFQLIDKEQLMRCVEAAPKRKLNAPMETADRVVERSLGSFAVNSNMLDYANPGNCACCNNNGAQGLYQIWEGIVQDKGNGTAQVNLLLNRASRLVDVDSYLPYEGKVVVKNKTAKRVFLRVPLWAPKGDVRCRIGSNLVDAQWLNNYLIFENVKLGDQIVVEFPMVERTIKRPQVPGGTVYTIHLRGNTVIDIWPRSDASKALISSGTLALDRPTLLPVPNVKAKDARVSVDCRSGGDCGILLRYRDDWNYLMASFSARERSIWFQEMVQGLKGPVQSLKKAEAPFGTTVHLVAEANGSTAALTISDGRQTLTANYAIQSNNESGEPGLIVEEGGQRFDNFLVSDLNGKTIFEDKFDRPDGLLLGGWTRANVYRYYRRDQMRANEAPMVKKQRFAPARTLIP